MNVEIRHEIPKGNIEWKINEESSKSINEGILESLKNAQEKYLKESRKKE